MAQQSNSEMPNIGEATALDARFKRQARAPSDAASTSLLARGRVVTYREVTTPAGCVMRKYPDGRIETVRIDLGQ